MSSEIIVKMNQITKHFEDQLVLDKTSFSIRRGEVCSILGENGAGKTTFMKILAGIHTPDSGEIWFDGKPVKIGSVVKSRKLGIYMIHQEPRLINSLSIEKNLFIGQEVCCKFSPLINKKEQVRKSQEILDRLQLHLAVDTLVSELSIAQKKMVELAKAVLSDAKVIIFDEITEPFSEAEIKNFYVIVEKLKASGIAIVFISHRIEEVMRISDKIVIIRDGETFEEIPQKPGYDMDSLIKKMAGEDYINRYPKSHAKKGAAVLELRNVWNASGTVKDASLYVRRGEIVGLAGLQGSGKTSLSKVLAGIDPAVQGEILLNRHPVHFDRKYKASRQGIAYFSENNELNIHKLMGTSYNITLASLNKVTQFFHISQKLVNLMTRYYVKQLNIQVPDKNLELRYLSRGTQQKVALSKWLQADARILVMDEPSISLDIPSKVELYNLINKLSHNGKSIILASSDIHELVGMCDRIYVISEGNVVAELNSQETGSTEILRLAFGGCLSC